MLNCTLMWHGLEVLDTGVLLHLFQDWLPSIIFAYANHFCLQICSSILQDNELGHNTIFQFHYHITTKFLLVSSLTIWEKILRIWEKHCILEKCVSFTNKFKWEVYRHYMIWFWNFDHPNIIIHSPLIISI